MIIRKSALMLSALVTLACASISHAGSLTASLNSMSNGGVSPYTSNLTTMFHANNGTWVTNNNTIAGKINWTNVQVPGVADPAHGFTPTAWTPSDIGAGYFATGQNFYSFCIEGTQNVWTPGTSNWNVVDLATAPQPHNQYINPVIGAGMGTQKASWLTEYWSKNIGSVVDNASAAGFQLGVWGIVYNATGLAYFQSATNKLFDSSVSSNNFLLVNPGNDAALTKASAFLKKVDGTAPAQQYSLFGLTDGYYQDQVVGFVNVSTPGNEPTAVPLPAALPAGLAMLVSMFVIRKMKRSSKLD